MTKETGRSPTIAILVVAGMLLSSAKASGDAALAWKTQDELRQWVVEDPEVSVTVSVEDGTSFIRLRPALEARIAMPTALAGTLSPAELASWPRLVDQQQWNAVSVTLRHTTALRGVFGVWRYRNSGRVSDVADLPRFDVHDAPGDGRWHTVTMRFREAVHYNPSDEIVGLILMLAPDEALLQATSTDAYLDLASIEFTSVPESITSPVLTDFAPRRGKQFGLVTIRGGGFAEPADRNLVLFGGVDGIVQSGDSNTLTVEAPGCCTGPITVRTPGGGTAQSQEPFVFLLPPAVFRVLSGNNQVGDVGSTLAPLRVLVSDGDTGLPDVPVTFSVVGGTAHLQSSVVTTADDGVAAVAVTLGSTPGAVRIRAEIDGFKPRFFDLTARAAP
jgi:hypothetical protein